ncbi:hypothetical protein Stube_35030 [Streptomyces tubercidicus]|uniref:Uncharacterized protein n=1 Tax=Streptomyces tubercidicus TaxID=47759 RepID=A0A640UTS4_9ACTN|nr:hypothetical protein Stube_35030 [Streptomyces tubercidicus]
MFLAELLFAGFVLLDQAVGEAQHPVAASAEPAVSNEWVTGQPDAGLRRMCSVDKRARIRSFPAVAPTVRKAPMSTHRSQPIRHVMPVPLIRHKVLLGNSILDRKGLSAPTVACHAAPALRSIVSAPV